MPRIILEGFIDIPEKDLDIAKQELPNHIELTKAEEGCVVFQVTQDTKISNRFTVYEEFDSKEAFIKHQERVKASQWGNVTKNAKRNYQIKSI